MNATLNNNFFEDFIARYEELDRQYYRMEERARRNDKNRDRANELCTRIMREQDGMENVLNMMGYKLEMQNEKYIIVKKGE